MKPSTSGLSAGMVIVSLLAGCSPAGTGSVSDPLETYRQQDVAWQPCDGEFECAVFEVPLDYDEPAGKRLEIAAIRLPASGTNPTGSLVVNPGGPGGSGIDYAHAAPQILSSDVRRQFDIVGFDPRGIGESEPVTCLSGAELDEFIGGGFESADGTEDPADATRASIEEFAETSQEFVAACERHSGALLPHIGTANVARDMDILRSILGDEKLTYLGKSYGTFIGTNYAELFPERVRALVLDGAMAPELNALQLSVGQAEGFAAALRSFVADCLDRDDCPLSTGTDPTVDDGIDRLTDLFERAGEEPLANALGDGREINRSRVQTGVLAALYSERMWPRVRDALRDGFAGDGTALLRLGDQLYGRGADGDFANQVAALTAVTCLDRDAPEKLGAYREAAEEAAQEAPLFGPSLAWGSLSCAYWSAEATDAPEEFDAAGAAPILVVGTTRDPATPYAWAKTLASELDSGVLLTRDGDGHTAYNMGNPCVVEAVDHYLIQGEPPPEGTTCG